MKIFITCLVTAALASSAAWAQPTPPKAPSPAKPALAKPAGKKAPPTPTACDPGKKQIVIVNKSTSVVWAPGTKVKWKTSHGEQGVALVSSTIKPGKALTVGITKPAPKKCKAKVRLP